MNTSSGSITPLRTFGWLLRREYWEHKGGFFWAPIWAGGISLLLTFFGLVLAEVTARKVFHPGSEALKGVHINGIDLGSITMQMTPEALVQVSNSLAASSASAMLWPMLVLGFVVFFYALGSLYDERRDRSVLFWKSLPLSDRDSVLSKVATALVVGPLIATVVGVVSMIAYVVMIGGFVLLHGGNPFQLLWSPGAYFMIVSMALAALPIYILWALPSVGWLMLCSAWAKSKPFLWAIMLPVFAGVFLTWFDWMSSMELGSTWFWREVVGHLLGGAFPGTWMRGMDVGAIEGMMNFELGSSLSAMYSVLGRIDLWVGAVAGVAMIFAAIRLRSRRDDV